MGAPSAGQAAAKVNMKDAPLLREVSTATAARGEHTT